MKTSIVVTIFLAVISISLTNTANASCIAGSCTGIGTEVITSVYPTADRIYIEAPAAYKSQLNCTLVSGYFMTLETSHSTFKEIYSTILTAIATGKK